MVITKAQIQEMITRIAGVEALTVLKELEGKENVNEFLIVEKLGIPIQALRNILYKFDENNLVSHTRKKDRKKGWYIYYWTFRPEEAERAVVNMHKKRLDLVKRQLDREQGHEYYMCPDKCVRMTLENAMENNFSCRECGKILEPENNQKRLSKFRREIRNLEEFLTKVERAMRKKAKEKEDAVRKELEAKEAAKAKRAVKKVKKKTTKKVKKKVKKKATKKTKKKAKKKAKK